MDNATLQAAFAAHTKGQDRFTRRMVVALSDMADCTPRQMVLRCERLGLCKAGSWDWFTANGGITTEHIAEARASHPGNKE